jgi:hypothetical protein
MRKSVSVLLSGIVLSLSVQAQSVTPAIINVAGNSYSKDFFSLDWSVGELSVVESMRSFNGLVVVTNGFLQPHSFTDKESEPRTFTSEELRISPNPTYNQIEVTLSTRQQGIVHLQVYDAHGKIVRTKKFTSYGHGAKELVDLSSFAAGTYFLRINLQPVPGSTPKNGFYKIVKL